jgi:Tat protein secretion system quality control protein TatD with DNase activity
VVYVAEKIAKIKQITPEKVAEITTQNAKNLFNI